MKAFGGYEKVRALSEREQLPPDGYVCRIMGAREVTYQGREGAFSRLEISLDIAEGEHTGYYADDYKAQSGEDRRWRGVLRLYVPSDDGSERDEFSKRRFKGAMEAVEDSNPGYRWDWNEAGLKGKVVGCLFRREEWEWDGRTGWSTRPFKFLDAALVRERRFRVPEDRPLPGAASSLSVSDLKESDEELPF